MMVTLRGTILSLLTKIQMVGGRSKTITMTRVLRSEMTCWMHKVKIKLKIFDWYIQKNKRKNMKLFYYLAMVVFLTSCISKPKEMGVEFEKFDGYYFLDDQLRLMKTNNIPNKDSIWFARLDVKTSSLELIDMSTWRVVKLLELNPYKDSIFYISGFDDMFLHLRPSTTPDGQHALRFIRDKDDTSNFITSGYFVHEIKSIEDCKKFLADWKADLERTNCDKESCFGN